MTTSRGEYLWPQLGFLLLRILAGLVLTLGVVLVLTALGVVL